MRVQHTQQFRQNENTYNTLLGPTSTLQFLVQQVQYISMSKTLIMLHYAAHVRIQIHDRHICCNPNSLDIHKSTNNMANVSHEITKEFLYLHARSSAIRCATLAFSAIRFATFSLWSASVNIVGFGLIVFAIAALASSLVNLAITIGDVSHAYMCCHPTT